MLRLQGVSFGSIGAPSNAGGNTPRSPCAAYDVSCSETAATAEGRAGRTCNPGPFAEKAFFKGKGKSKGSKAKGKSSGFGAGRKLNPRGRDGEIMKCSICDDQYHLRARCHRNLQKSIIESSAYTESATGIWLHCGSWSVDNSFWMFEVEPTNAFSTFDVATPPQQPSRPHYPAAASSDPWHGCQGDPWSTPGLRVRHHDVNRDPIIRCHALISKTRQHDQAIQSLSHRHHRQH